MNVMVFGAAGAIGKALAQRLAHRPQVQTLWAVSRRPIDVSLANQPACRPRRLADWDEASISAVIDEATADAPLDLVLVATGQLHGPDMSPEKSLKHLSAQAFHQAFQANTILPALIAKHTIPALARDKRAVFAALSARVGSISDNRLGGWYAYRASKAALNMVIACAAIEAKRTHPQSVVVGLHPGTVDSDLSAPFQQHVPQGKLFTPDFSAQRLLQVLDALTPDKSGMCFAWDGQTIPPRESLENFIERI